MSNFPFKVGDFIQHEDFHDIILRIISIDDELTVEVTAFSDKACQKVMELTKHKEFEMNKSYWMTQTQIRLNYQILPNFRIIAEFNDNLKGLINGQD